MKGLEVRRLTAWLPGALLVGAVSFLSACAAVRTAGDTYRDPRARFEVRLPPAGWLPAPLDGAALSFRSAELQAAMALLADCRTPEPGELPAVARHLFFGLEEKRILEREAVRLHGADGVRTRLSARLDGAPVEVEGVTIRRAGCLYDFVYAAPPPAFPLGRPDFDAFVESWAPLAGP